MRRTTFTLVLGLSAGLLACGSDDDDSESRDVPDNGPPSAPAPTGTGPAPPTPTATGDVPPPPPVDEVPTPIIVPWPATGEPCVPDMAAADGAATDGAATDGALQAAPSRLVAGTAVPLGVTSDGYVVFRQQPMFQAVKIGSSDPPIDLSGTPGAVLIRGRVVFHYENIDYIANTGELMMFTGPSCGRRLGATLLDEDFVAASADGSVVLYASNVTATTMDIVVASRDLVHQQTLVAAVGRPSESTCRPRYGFAGSRIVIGSCAEGTQSAVLQVYTLEGDAWIGSEIARDVSPNWSADASGERIVYLTTSSQARLWQNGDLGAIDESVTWTLIEPNGSAMLYAVGDQLRRTALDAIVPIPIVTNEFRNVAAWSPTLERVLYSKTVLYEGGETRDLFLIPTNEFTAVPPALVTEPIARLSRSAFTVDGAYVMYIVGSDDRGGGTLHVSPVSGAPPLTFDGVDTVVAVREDLIVFSTGRSDPMLYPIVANLQGLRAGGDGMPFLVQTPIIDGRSIYVTPDGQSVIYARPRAADPAMDVEGLWIHPLP